MNDYVHVYDYVYIYVYDCVYIYMYIICNISIL